MSGRNFKTLQQLDQPEEKVAEIDALELGSILGDQIRNAIDTSSGVVESEVNVADALVEQSSVVARLAFQLPSPNKLGSVARLTTLPSCIDHSEAAAGAIPSSDAGFESVALSHSSLLASSILSREVAEDGSRFLESIDSALLSSVGAKLDGVVFDALEPIAIATACSADNLAGITSEEVKTWLASVSSVAGSDYRIVTSTEGSLILKSLFNANEDSILGLPVEVSPWFSNQPDHPAALLVSLKHAVAVGLGSLDLRSVSEGKGLPNAGSDSVARVARLRASYGIIPSGPKTVAASLVLSP